MFKNGHPLLIMERLGKNIQDYRKVCTCGNISMTEHIMIVIRVQILDKAVYISLCANALRKSINPSLLSHTHLHSMFSKQVSLHAQYLQPHTKSNQCLFFLSEYFQWNTG